MKIQKPHSWVLKNAFKNASNLSQIIIVWAVGTSVGQKLKSLSPTQELAWKPQGPKLLS